MSGENDMSERFVTLTWDFIRDKSTTMQEKLILAEIEALSSLKRGCIASNDHFANLLGVKKESVSRTINALKEKGYIDVEIMKGSRNHERKISINKMLFGGKQNVIEGLTNCLESKDNKTINKTINKKDNAQSNELFEQFWSMYDKKTGKSKALAKWSKMTKQEQDDCLEAIPAYVESTPDKQYRKDPTTYLNGKHWEDEIITKKPQSKNNNNLNDGEVDWDWVERTKKEFLSSYN
jgi:Mn-dependent DtxR family transcriptional regulator